MKTTVTVACISLKSAWQAVSLRSALTALLLAFLTALHAAEPPHILLREALQYKNIGDSGRVPGTTSAGA